jgi:hypothetical protein
MKVAREILSAFLILIALYLVLLHSGGFAKDIGAIGNFAMGSAKVLQGR